MSVSELLPCPFDSGAATINDRRHDERSGYNVTCEVSCKMCGASVSVNTKHDSAGWCNESTDSLHARAIAAWNRRTPPTYQPRINSGDVDNATPPAQAAEALEERVMVAIMELGLHDCVTADVRRMARAAIAAMRAGE